MIKKEFYMTRADGVKLYKTYSDTDMDLLQNETGNVYNEAIDVEDSVYTYTEIERKAEETEAE